ncbi:MAG TPA: type I-U CRISPR-associated protein Cas7, partial [Chloroflexota bacterium]|nr:type I-U CRISPR-associated protein Cas7 [Chloroflexota bacterium]
TSSLQEFHRLNSPYILDADNHAFVHQFVRALVPDNRALAEVLKIKDDSLLTKLKEYFAGPGVGPVDERALARTVFRVDPNCVLHGLFLARDYLVGGRLRLTRLLSGFIEASDVRPAENGGVKFDRINPSGDTKLGFGHVPFHRTEYTARQITAYFNLDLATLRAYGLGRDAERLLVALSLWKISRFLRAGLRLRTACDLECGSVRISRQTDFASPADLALDEILPTLIAACGELFAQPPVTEIHWEPPAKAKTAKAATEAWAEIVDDGDADDDP